MKDGSLNLIENIAAVCLPTVAVSKTRRDALTVATEDGLSSSEKYSTNTGTEGGRIGEKSEELTNVICESKIKKCLDYKSI